jgi:hypothetical protein
MERTVAQIGGASRECGTFSSGPRFLWLLGMGVPACMARPEEYRRYARECLELASVSRVPRARAALRRMAQVWLRLAQEAENRARSQGDEVSELG